MGAGRGLWVGGLLNGGLCPETAGGKQTMWTSGWGRGRLGRALPAAGTARARPRGSVPDMHRCPEGPLWVRQVEGGGPGGSVGLYQEGLAGH